MNGFGWIPPVTAPVTTARAVPAAVTWALKSQGLAAYPRTPMAIPPTTYRAVITLAEGELRKTGIPYSPTQLHAELSSRQYQFQRRSDFGATLTGDWERGSPLSPTIPAGLTAAESRALGLEVSPLAPPTRPFLSGKTIPIALAVVGGTILIWMVVKKTA